ncbi:hypothetical protein ACFR9U_07180 [Halorientalis brevis]|uniref:Uncharacterized protein n=1 Tax=Halorientalis brevis TaxID=1126241 RepID=A0ABD6CBL4_9EURY|nr:hypothetical protein [Halorientalis brevis]
MSSPWITEQGKVGTVTVSYTDDNWQLKEPAVDDNVVCLFLGDNEIPASNSPIQIKGEVSRYTISGGDDPNYLMFTPIDYEPASEDSSSHESKETHHSTSSQSSSEDTLPRRTLSELSGTGEYVSVEAVVNNVSWVMKSSTGPDVKGSLTTEDGSEKVVFIVENGVSHPYLEVGKMFEFRRVRDHYYRKDDQIQVQITKQTDFIEKGTAWPSARDGRSSSDTRLSSSQRSYRNWASSSSENLHEIAAEMIGDKEFTVQEEEQDSAVGNAKKMARSQNRDPAIDPRFQASEEDDEN